jgi:acidic leucine-rich nuclear phosphoprotein 32 family protein B
MSIKKAILDKNEGNEVEKSEYVNLILDELVLPQGDISAEDKAFLEGFTETQFLSLNTTGLKSLQNLPQMEKLERLELQDNKFTGEHLGVLCQLYPNLRILKLSNNQIKTVEELSVLKGCEKLEALDVNNNPLCTNEGYAKVVRELVPQVEVVDGFNKEGQEVVSEDEDDSEDDDDEDDDDDDDDEDGEDEDEEGDEDDDEGEEEEEEGEDEEEKTADKSCGKKRSACDISGKGSATKTRKEEAIES